MPPLGVGTEAGTVGTAIDQRLRLAFTTAAPIDLATHIGISLTASTSDQAGLRMHAVGTDLAIRLTETVHRLNLDDRATPMDRTYEEEEDLARLLLAAAWYQVLTRSRIGFAFTPLARTAQEAPDSFTLQRLLELPNRDMVTDVATQLHQAARGPLNTLRARTQPKDCLGGPTFANHDLSADADLLVDGLLLDFKNTRHPRRFPMHDAWQLVGYLLLDTQDHHRIDTLGTYLTRSGTLATWPVEEYLDLLGACRRNLAALRAVFAELLAGCTADIDPSDHQADERIRRLLEELSPTIQPGHCPVCAQLITGQLQEYCSRWCGVRAPTLRKKGLLLQQCDPTVRLMDPQPERVRSAVRRWVSRTRSAIGLPAGRGSRR